MPTDPPDVELARTRARRRLIGAAVLVLIAVVAFPIVFETQPRPTSSAASIEVARNDAAAAKSASSRAVTGVVTPAPRANDIITESAGEAGREVAPPAQAASPAASAARIAAKEPAAKDTAAPPVGKPAATADAGKPPVRPPAAASKPANNDAGRAQALLEGKTEVAKADTPKAEAPKADKPKPETAAAGAAGEAAGRFIVQVGAFADVNAAREARQRVEKLGLKTYTQVIDTPGGKRIRVRVGPFGAKDEAERVVARIKSAGMSPAVLTL